MGLLNPIDNEINHPILSLLPQMDKQVENLKKAAHRQTTRHNRLN